MAIPSGNDANQSFQFRAMNTHIDITLSCNPEDAADYLDLARDWFHYAEERFSRFEVKSELSHLNRLAGETCLVSETMLEVLVLADSYRQLTDGIFNPLLHHAITSAGYSDSFERLQHAAQPIKSGILPVEEAQPPLPLLIQPAMRSVKLPSQAGLDLGGIVKGWSVKRLADYFRDTLQVKRGLINAGGDLTVWGGASAEGAPWIIDIEHPWQTSDSFGRLTFSEGAAATSSILGRQWTTDHGPMHHLIDPRTMRPSASDVVQCTVTGGQDSDTVACEVWAKVLCVLGTEEGLALLNRKGVRYEALLFTANQETHFYGNPESLGTIWQQVDTDHCHIHKNTAASPRYGGEWR
ncbi:FAD:protein FMN transferase [Paenibacillus rigui]|uniref:FAD:protein FMN transferase n=1 Tax=Paenibacillus rigui TaxID=554312 RepID=A0A229UTW1_9BACL|nr:FAD:protein FMN transferase [Paenibacillus rigui]OXM86339.1 hypothetical protein CF651_10420 [Paenibacillus rigui]